jgi:hypothetical protein
VLALFRIAIYIDSNLCTKLYKNKLSDFVRVTKFIQQKILNENEGTEFSHSFIQLTINLVIQPSNLNDSQPLSERWN